jgi:hypothetical protein
MPMFSATLKTAYYTFLRANLKYFLHFREANHEPGSATRPFRSFPPEARRCARCGCDPLGQSDRSAACAYHHGEGSIIKVVLGFRVFGSRFVSDFALSDFGFYSVAFWRDDFSPHRIGPRSKYTLDALRLSLLPSSR